MTNVILSKRRPGEKGDNHSGSNGLIVLGAKLRAIKAITNAVITHPDLAEIEVFDVMSGVDDLIGYASDLCEQLDATQIAADISAAAAGSDALSFIFK